MSNLTQNCQSCQNSEFYTIGLSYCYAHDVIVDNRANCGMWMSNERHCKQEACVGCMFDKLDCVYKARKTVIGLYTEYQSHKTTNELLNQCPCDDCILDYDDSIYCKVCKPFEIWERALKKAEMKDALKRMSNPQDFKLG